MLSDFKSAVRQLSKAPGFTAVVLVILALGIGAATAMFTVVNSVLLRPVDYPQSEQLMVIAETNLPEFPRFSVSPANFLDFSRQTDAFSGMYATSGASFNYTGGAEPVRVAAQRVTGQYFETLRVAPLLGRTFGPAEDAIGKDNVVVLMHSFWQRQFGGRPDIVGQTMNLNGTVYTVIGVLSPNFRRGSSNDVIVPMAFSAAEAATRGGHNLNVVGRLKLGVTGAQATAQLVTLTTRLAQQYPDSNKGWGVRLIPILENNIGNVKPTLYALLAAVSFLLLIACANVANLLLAKATARQREMSIRAALGASRWQTIRLLLIESLLLALVGGAAGILVARWGLDLLLGIAPDALPRAAEVSLDPRALLAAVGLSVLTGLIFGLAPALQSSRPRIADTLGDGSRGASEGGRRHWLRSVLVVTEIALALVLLTGAGLLMRSFVKMRGTSPGFDPSGVLTSAVALPNGKYDTPEKQVAFIDALLARESALPGVEAVGATHVMPFGGGNWILGLEIEGKPVAPSDQPSVTYFSVSPGYFKALGVTLLSGRGFTAQDRLTSPPVVVVSQSFAAKFFPAGALGRRINVNNPPQQWSEIVGVVADVKSEGIEEAPRPQVYDVLAQHPFGNVYFAVRAKSTAAAAALAAPVRREVYAVDAAQPVFGVTTLDQLLADSMARGRFTVTLFGIFSGLAVTLAALGIYSVMAYGVAQRTREFGIRLALGAQPADILRLVLQLGARLVALGVAVGVLGAFGAARLIRSMLFETDPADPFVFTVVALGMAFVAAFACWLPARKATQVSPMIALRAD